MKLSRTITLLAASAALLAVPASAAAAPNVKDVRAAVKESRQSIGDARQAALAGDVRELRSSVRELGRHARDAHRKARKIRRNASTPKQRVRATQALTAVAGQYDQVIGSFASILDQVPADAQYLLTQGLALSIDAQQRLISMLTKLAPRLPEPAATAVLAAVDRFETDGDLAVLVDALASDEVVDGVKSVLSEKVDQIVTHLESVVDRLAAIDPRLAETVGGALVSVRGMLDQVDSMLSGLLDSILGGEAQAFPGLGELPGIAKVWLGA